MISRNDARSLTFRQALLPGGWASDVRITVAVDGRIASVEEGAAAGGPFDGDIALAGLCNAHSHGFQRALAGRTERREGSDTFWSWRELMYRFAGAITPAQLQAVTAQAYVEMLERERQ